MILKYVELGQPGCEKAQLDNCFEEKSSFRSKSKKKRRKEEEEEEEKALWQPKKRMLLFFFFETSTIGYWMVDVANCELRKMKEKDCEFDLSFALRSRN